MKISFQFLVLGLLLSFSIQADAKAMLSPEIRSKAKNDELKRWNEFWSRSQVTINLDKDPMIPDF